MSDGSAVAVKAYSTRWEADLAKAVLESNGISAVVAGDDAGGSDPWLGSAQRIRVLVREDDAVLARRLLADDA
jgi:hypothetical protein